MKLKDGYVTGSQSSNFSSGACQGRPLSVTTVCPS